MIGLQFTVVPLFIDLLRETQWDIRKSIFKMSCTEVRRLSRATSSSCQANGNQKFFQRSNTKAHLQTIVFGDTRQCLCMRPDFELGSSGWVNVLRWPQIIRLALLPWR